MSGCSSAPLRLSCQFCKRLQIPSRATVPSCGHAVCDTCALYLEKKTKTDHSHQDTEDTVAIYCSLPGCNTPITLRTHHKTQTMQGTEIVTGAKLKEIMEGIQLKQAEHGPNSEKLRCQTCYHLHMKDDLRPQGECGHSLCKNCYRLRCRILMGQRWRDPEKAVTCLECRAPDPEGTIVLEASKVDTAWLKQTETVGGNNCSLHCHFEFEDRPKVDGIRWISQPLVWCLCFRKLRYELAVCNLICGHSLCVWCLLSEVMFSLTNDGLPLCRKPDCGQAVSPTTLLDLLSLLPAARPIIMEAMPQMLGKVMFPSVDFPSGDFKIEIEDDSYAVHVALLNESSCRINRQILEVRHGTKLQDLANAIYGNHSYRRGPIKDMKLYCLEDESSLSLESLSIGRSQGRQTPNSTLHRAPIHHNKEKSKESRRPKTTSSLPPTQRADDKGKVNEYKRLTDLPWNRRFDATPAPGGDEDLSDSDSDLHEEEEEENEEEEEEIEQSQELEEAIDHSGRRCMDFLKYGLRPIEQFGIKNQCLVVVDWDEDTPTSHQLTLTD